MDWKTVEILAYSHFAGQGYKILVPLACNDDYDFVIHKDGVFKTINAKLAGLKGKSPNSWSISNSTNFEKVDILLIYMPKHAKFIEVKASLLNNNRQGHAKLIPTEILKEHNCYE